LNVNRRYEKLRLVVTFLDEDADATLGGVGAGGRDKSSATPSAGNAESGQATPVPRSSRSLAPGSARAPREGGGPAHGVPGAAEIAGLFHTSPRMTQPSSPWVPQQPKALKSANRVYGRDRGWSVPQGARSLGTGAAREGGRAPGLPWPPGSSPSSPAAHAAATLAALGRLPLCPPSSFACSSPAESRDRCRRIMSALYREAAGQKQVERKVILGGDDRAPAGSPSSGDRRTSALNGESQAESGLDGSPGRRRAGSDHLSGAGNSTSKALLEELDAAGGAKADEETE